MLRKTRNRLAVDVDVLGGGTALHCLSASPRDGRLLPPCVVKRVLNPPLNLRRQVGQIRRNRLELGWQRT